MQVLQINTINPAYLAADLLTLAAYQCCWERLPRVLLPTLLWDLLLRCHAAESERLPKCCCVMLLHHCWGLRHGTASGRGCRPGGPALAQQGYQPGGTRGALYGCPSGAAVSVGLPPCATAGR